MMFTAPCSAPLLFKAFAAILNLAKLSGCDPQSGYVGIWDSQIDALALSTGPLNTRNPSWVGESRTSWIVGRARLKKMDKRRLQIDPLSTGIEHATTTFQNLRCGERKNLFHHKNDFRADV